MSKRIPKFSNVDTKEANEALDGYVPCQSPQELKPGDNVKYSVDSVLKGGGLVKTNKYPEFLVLKNKFKSISWCVQLKEPTLQIWAKTQEMETKELEDKKKVWKLYKAGKLLQPTRELDEMRKIYQMYKDGKLVQKK